MKLVSRYPQHATLYLLLKNKQLDACRMAAEAMIEAKMAALRSPSHQGGETVSGMMTRLQDEERELACLQIVHCLALFGLHQPRRAAEKAEIAAYIAQKLQDTEVFAEASYRAGVCHVVCGDYQTAIQRFSDSISAGAPEFHGDALYSRGFAYENTGALLYAVPDYDAAGQWAADRDPDLARRSAINLAWVLIRTKQFPRAEQILAQMAALPGAEGDHLLQLHIAHDHAHMAHLKGDGAEAVNQAMRALRMAGREYPHVRARIALTLMEVAMNKQLPQEAFILGVLAKRLAGKAQRFDLDEEASRLMQELEINEGTDCLAQALLQIGQALPGVATRRRGARSACQKLGGAG